jgi:hypothetical protein
MPTFPVESYKVRVEIERAGTPPVKTLHNRVLEVVSPVQFHGIVERAVLYFSTRWDNWTSPAVAGYLDQTNPYQPRLTGWFPAADFSLFYEVLRSESPLYVFYDLAPIGGASYVSNIAIGSSTEPIGEGPADHSP